MKIKSDAVSAVNQNSCALSLLVAAVLLSASAAYSAEWKTDAAANWNNNANWQNPATFPNSAGATADVTRLNITADRAITLGQNITVGTLLVDDRNGSHSYTVGLSAATHTLSFDVPSGSALLKTFSTANDTGIQCPVVLRDDIELCNNSEGRIIEFFKPITESVAGRTVFINGSSGGADNHGGVRFHPGATNGFSKLAVGTNNRGILWVHSVDDQNLGAVPASFTADAVTLDVGAVISRGVSSTLTIHANRGVTLGWPGGGGFNAPNSGSPIVVDSVISGLGSLTVYSGNGGGTVTLNKANTYTGGTVVAHGAILKLMTTNTLAAAAPLTLLSSTNTAAYGKVNLAFSGAQTVGRLCFDKVEQEPGTWGSSSSSASHKDDNRFSGSGVLNAAFVPMPVLSLDGGTYAGSTLIVTVSCATAGVTLRYTINGTEPTTSSSTVANGGVLNVTLPGTLKVKAWKSGYATSFTKSAIYTKLVATAGSPKYLFIDEQYVQSTSGVQKVYHQPVKRGLPVLTSDRAWEQTPSESGLYGVYPWSSPVWDPAMNRWRMWYQGGSNSLFMCAESTDGLVWTKPSLNLVTWNGNKNNNIVNLYPALGGYDTVDTKRNRASVIRDALTTDVARRYKAVAVAANDFVKTLVSSNGLTWSTLATTTLLTGDEYRLGLDDRTGTFMLTSKLKFKNFAGYPIPGDHVGGRLTWVYTSPDFQNWFGPELIMYADPVDEAMATDYVAGVKANPDRRQALVDISGPDYGFGGYYNMPLFQYEGMYMGLAMKTISTGTFESFDAAGVPNGANGDSFIFPVLASSRNLLQWNRHTREPFVDLSLLSQDYRDDGMIQMAAPVRNGDELFFYYWGSRFTHAGWWGLGLPDETWDKAGVTSVERTNYPFSSIYVARMRLDGFVSLKAGSTAGTVVTKAIPIGGTSLRVNANAAGGELRAEVLNAATGVPIPGYTLVDAQIVTSDAVSTGITWSEKPDVSELSGQTVKIRFQLKNADLYAFWFENEPSVETPTFSPDGGVQVGSSVDVTVSCATADATIRYTTNGNDPTESDATVASGSTVSVPLPGTLKAKAFKTGMIASAVKSASYTAITPVVWNLDNNGNWNNNGNWLNSGPFPNGMNALADFSQLNITTASRTVTLGQTITVGSLLIGDTDGSHGYTITGNVLTFDVSSGNASATQVAGSAATFINSEIVLNDDVNFTNNADVGFNITAKITGAKTVNVSAPNTSNVTLNGGGNNAFSKLVVTAGNAAANYLVNDTAFGAVPASATADAITLNGGGLAIAGVNGTLTIHANRGITLGANGGTLNATSVRLITVNSVIAGTAGGSLTIAGSGTVTLNNANTYDGDTIINSGTLKLNVAGLPHASAVYLTNTAVLNLNFTGTDAIGAFYVNGVNQGSGTFNSGTHPGRITGSGALQVTAASPPGTLTNASRSGANFSFNIAGNGNQVVQASTNLANTNAWVNLATNTAPFSFTDTNAVNLYPKRFYRTGTP